MRIEMTREPVGLRFVGTTPDGAIVVWHMEQAVWEALGEPDRFVLRVR
jgi:hypothetical protein